MQRLMRYKCSDILSFCQESAQTNGNEEIKFDQHDKVAEPRGDLSKDGDGLPDRRAMQEKKIAQGVVKVVDPQSQQKVYAQMLSRKSLVDQMSQMGRQEENKNFSPNPQPNLMESRPQPVHQDAEEEKKIEMQSQSCSERPNSRSHLTESDELFCSSQYNDSELQWQYPISDCELSDFENLNRLSKKSAVLKRMHSHSGARRRQNLPTLEFGRPVGPKSMGFAGHSDTGSFSDPDGVSLNYQIEPFQSPQLLEEQVEIVIKIMRVYGKPPTVYVSDGSSSSSVLEGKSQPDSGTERVPNVLGLSRLNNQDLQDFYIQQDMGLHSNSEDRSGQGHNDSE